MASETTAGTTIPGSRSRASGGVGDIAQLLSALSGLFVGKNETTTQQTKFDQNTLNTMLQRAFERNNGLADIVGGQRRAGLYNSSTTNLLANDFTSRMAAEVAARGAPQVTTVQSPAAVNPMLALAGLGILQAISGGDKAAKVKKAGDAATTTPTTSADTTGSFFSNPLESVGSGVSTAFNNIASALGFGGSSPAATAVANVGGVSPMTINANMDPSFISDMGLSYATSPMTEQAKMLRDQVAGFDAVAGVPGFGGLDFMSGLSSALSGNVEGAIGDIGKSWFGASLGQALTPILGPIGGILGAIFGGLF